MPGSYSNDQDIEGAYFHGAHNLTGKMDNMKKTSQHIIFRY